MAMLYISKGGLSMGLENRKELYRKIEEKRKKPLIVYVTSIRSGIQVMMASDVIPCIIKQVQQIPKDVKEVDFLIISNGGDPITSLRIISILRERFTKISVLVPYVAYSAATILSLGADEIVMHPYSNLGPVDPQMQVPKNNQPTSQIHFSSEDISNYIDFLKNDIGITDQAHLTTAFNSLATELGSMEIGYAKRNQQLSLFLSQKMLEGHIKDKAKASSIAKALMSSYYHHGYAVSRTEAKSVGLPITNPDDELEVLLWDVWEDFNEEMKCSKAFDPISELLTDPNTKNRLMTVPIVNLPANTPLQIAVDKIRQVVAGIVPTTQNAISLEVLLAVAESARLSMHFKQSFDMLAWRNEKMELNYNITVHSSGWNEI